MILERSAYATIKWGSKDREFGGCLGDAWYFAMMVFSLLFMIILSFFERRLEKLSGFCYQIDKENEIDVSTISAHFVTFLCTYRHMKSPLKWNVIAKSIYSLVTKKFSFAKETKMGFSIRRGRFLIREIKAMKKFNASSDLRLLFD